jgi:thiol:disulfide interchange protein DsbD
VQDLATKASGAGGYSGIFFMGAALVITSFTCTAPIVGTLLPSIVELGIVRVAVGMGIFGFTMAAPFVALSLMPSKVKAMPRSGEWMETLKVSLGFLELAATLKFVSMVDISLDWNAMPRELFLLLIAAIFGMWALYLFGMLRKAGTPGEGVGGGRMATGMAVVLFATYLLFGAMGYRLDFYMTAFSPPYSAPMVGGRAVATAEPGNGAATVSASHTIIKDDGDRALEVAKAEDKLLLYNFTGFN